MAYDSEPLWDSVPWRKWGEGPDKSLAWHKANVPYVPHGNALQTVDIWVPLETEDTPDVCSLEGFWVVYIHGGAWRDPMVDASSFCPTIAHIIRSHASSLPYIAGFVSINYTLSPHPSNPTDPSKPVDPSRTGKHPDHILDVLRALAFLQQKVGFGDKYALLGHSAGATLAFQVLMDVARWKSEEAKGIKLIKPTAVVGLDGLYDLPQLIKDPGEKHAHLTPIYEQIVRGAFGDSETAWHDVSPVSIKDWVKQWGTSKCTAVLVQSREDTLVPYRQLEGMWKALEPSIPAGLALVELTASGDHDELWARGDRIAKIVVEVVVNMLS